MHFLQAINSELSVLIVCNKTGGTIKGDIKKIPSDILIPEVINYVASKQANKLAGAQTVAAVTVTR